MLFSGRRNKYRIIFSIKTISILVLGIAISSFIYSLAHAADTTVVVEDINLYYAIKNNISCASYNDSTKEVTVTESCQNATTWLNIYNNNNIADISPLPTLFPNLYGLYINNHNISDYSPLAGLTKLTNLGLNYSQISDAGISQIASLTNLDTLYLHGSQISDEDFSLLAASLTKLTNLGLENNQITDLSPLTSLTGLTNLSLSSNSQITDFSPLTSLTNLKNLILNNNQISDASISQIASLTNLDTLYLANDQISDADLSLLAANLTNLTQLSLGNNQISDLSPLPTLFPNLRALSLTGNQISDVSPLASMTNLQTLNLSNNQISDVSPLDNLTNTMITTTGQAVTLEYSEKTFTSPQILTYTKDLYKNYDIVDCTDEPDVTGTSMLIQVCAEITNGLLSDDYATITADDTTQPVKIVLYTKMYMMGTMFNNTEVVSLTFIPASTESDAVDTPNTLDNIYLYLPAAIILVVGGIILTKKFSHR